ncbi:MAG: hypothetical protein KF718_22265 [Polyangiaceae bacterium]|nr:hypothetical protein [Polyangiaceae bacterium]
MVTVAERLAALGAHHDVVTWAAGYGTDFRAAFRECPRGDWLLGVAARRAVPWRRVARAAAACLRVGLDGRAPPDLLLDAAEVADGWACAVVEPGARESTRALLRALEPPDAATAALASAALLCVELDDGSLDSAALVPALVVEASLAGTIDCAWTSIVRHTQLATASAVREHIDWESLGCGR